MYNHVDGCYAPTWQVLSRSSVFQHSINNLHFLKHPGLIMVYYLNNLIKFINYWNN